MAESLVPTGSIMLGDDTSPIEQPLGELDNLPQVPERLKTVFEALGSEALAATPATMGWSTSSEIGLTSTPGDHDHLYADDRD